jgi:hypothetical protein
LETRRWVLPIVLVAVGLVWIGQGMGLLRGSSFMVDDLRWAVIGGGLVAVGVLVAWRRVRTNSA